jgi:hypothetical protein
MPFLENTKMRSWLGLRPTNLDAEPIEFCSDSSVEDEPVLIREQAFKETVFTGKSGL